MRLTAKESDAAYMRGLNERWNARAARYAATTLRSKTHFEQGWMERRPASTAVVTEISRPAEPKR